MGRAHRISLDGFSNRELLLWNPAVRMLPIQSCASNSGIDTEQRVQRGYLPVRAKGQAHTMIQKGTEGVGAAGAVMSDMALCKPAVVNRVVRVNRRDHVQLGEAVEILGLHMLSVLDAETRIGVALGFDYVGVQVKNG